MTCDAYTLLQTPLGKPGSARLRYGAAMTLYQAGHISADVLEVYRSCASLDAQDPLLLIAEYRLQNPFAVMAISSLLAEIDLYLMTISGPGVAEVRQRIASAAPAKVVPRTPNPNPMTDLYLDAAVTAASGEVPTLASAIRLAAPQMNWVTYDGYDPRDIGQAFAEGHAYTLLIGQDAPIAAQDFDLGLFLIAPHILYRDHNHAAPELYAPITGPHGWRFGVGTPLVIKPAHQPIWNEAFAPHLTKVGPVPFLCIFAWTRDVEAVAQVIPARDWAELEAMRLGGDDAR